MYSGFNPYNIPDDYEKWGEEKRRKALKENPHYKKFVEEKYEQIWKMYSNSESHRDDPTFYSEDFKNLINRMLNYKPAERLDIKGIKDHPWTKGPVPNAA